MSKAYGANPAFPTPKEMTQKDIDNLKLNPNNLRNEEY